MDKPKIPLEEIKIADLSPVYDLSSFDCGGADLNEFLKNDALKYHQSSLAKTILFIWREKIIGFCSLCCDSIKLSEKETEALKIDNRLRHPEYPAIKLARFARDNNFKSYGLGDLLLKFAIGRALEVDQKVACKFLTVDAYPDMAGWYEKHGFIRNLHGSYKDKENVSMRYYLKAVE